MSLEARMENVVAKMQQKHEDLKPFGDLISKDNFEKLVITKRNFIEDSKVKKDENRLLKIGIIGQIKRGKSSFLNALLFDGKDVLPKGATPMTAALTNIKYSEKPYAKVKFYSTIDWEAIEKKAKETEKQEKNDDFMGEISEEDRACLEIFQKAKPEILAKLNSSEDVAGVERIEDLLDRLENYVGADGKYTPIVKSLELGINIESIKDIEIIDTPGTNDPVISRGRVTQDFIGKCDVVFFLSLSSQFLDKNDMELFTQNMPNKGVRNIQLIGSLFDSAMLDEFNKYDDAQTLIENLKHKYSDRAKEDLEKISSRIGSKILSSLMEALPPVFISAMCYNIEKHFDNLNNEEKHVLKNLNEMYGDNFSRDDLSYIANIEQVEEKVDDIKKQKDELLEKGFEHLIEGAENQVVEISNDIKVEIKKDYEMLQENDVESLEKKQTIIQKTVESGTRKIDNVFESYIIGIEKEFAMLSQQLKNDIKIVSNIQVNTGTETYSEVTNRFTNFFNDNWGREERTKSYKYVNIHDAIGQLESFVRDSEVSISKTVENIIDIKLFRKEIMSNIVGLFDLSDDNFDPSDIVGTLKNSVNRITIPHVDIDTSSHIDTVRDKFRSSEVRDSQIDSLKAETSRVLKLILEDMKKEISNQTSDIILKLNDAKKSFLPVILKDLNDKLNKMKKDLADKEDSLKRYEDLLKIL